MNEQTRFTKSEGPWTKSGVLFTICGVIIGTLSAIIAYSTLVHQKENPTGPQNIYVKNDICHYLT